MSLLVVSVKYKSSFVLPPPSPATDASMSVGELARWIEERVGVPPKGQKWMIRGSPMVKPVERENEPLVSLVRGNSSSIGRIAVNQSAEAGKGQVSQLTITVLGSAPSQVSRETWEAAKAEAAAEEEAAAAARAAAAASAEALAEAEWEAEQEARRQAQADARAAADARRAAARQRQAEEVRQRAAASAAAARSGPVLPPGWTSNARPGGGQARGSRAPERPVDVFDLRVEVHEDTLIGDKVVLPPSVLQHLVAAEVQFPVFFAIRHTGDGPDDPVLVYARALEFTAPEGSAYVPAWMATRLQLSAYGAASGLDRMAFSVVSVTSDEEGSLPRATFMQLELVGAGWSEMRMESRDALLEYELRNYQTITKGVTIPVHSLSQRRNQLQLVVKTLEPSSRWGGAVIGNGDVAVDVVAAPDPAAPPVVLQISPSDPAKGSASAKLEPNEYLDAVLYVTADVLQAHAVLVVEATGTDADAYVSWHANVAGRARATLCDWWDDSLGSAQVRVDTDALAARAAALGVEAGGSLELVMSAHNAAESGDEVTLSVRLEASGAAHVLGTGAGGDGGETAADTTQCDFCGAQVPAASLALHAARCERVHSKCGECGEVTGVGAAAAKHARTAHQEQECIWGCGLRGGAAPLRVHALESCPYRLVTCRYCLLQLEAAGVGEHQGTCGARTRECEQCGSPVLRRHFASHTCTTDAPTATPMDEVYSS
jgi:hypothetical protein